MATMAPRGPFNLPEGDEDYPYMSEISDGSQMNNNNNPFSGRYGSIHREVHSTKKMPKEFPQRFIIVIMGFLAFVNIYMMYLNLSVTLPAMVIHNFSTNSSLTEQNNSLVNQLRNHNRTVEMRREKRHRNSKSKKVAKNRPEIHLNIEEVMSILAKANESKVGNKKSPLGSVELDLNQDEATVKPPSDFITAPKIRLSDEITRKILTQILEKQTNLAGTEPSSLLSVGVSLKASSTLPEKHSEKENKTNEQSTKDPNISSTSIPPVSDLTTKRPSETSQHKSPNIGKQAASSNRKTAAMEAKDHSDNNGSSTISTASTKNMNEVLITSDNPDTENQTEKIDIENTPKSISGSTAKVDEVISQNKTNSNADTIPITSTKPTTLNSNLNSQGSSGESKRNKRSLNEAEDTSVNKTTFAPMVVFPISSTRDEIEEKRNNSRFSLSLNDTNGVKQSDIPELVFATAIPSAISDSPTENIQSTSSLKSELKKVDAQDSDSIKLTTETVLELEESSTLVTTATEHIPAAVSSTESSTHSTLSSKVSNNMTDNITVVEEVTVGSKIDTTTLKILKTSTEFDTSTEQIIIDIEETTANSTTLETSTSTTTEKLISSSTEMSSTKSLQTGNTEITSGNLEVNTTEIGVPLPILSDSSDQNIATEETLTSQNKPQVNVESEVNKEHNIEVFFKESTAQNKSVQYDSSENIIENSSDVSVVKMKNVSISSYSNETASKNQSLGNNTSLTSIPCKIFEFNCSLSGSYDVIDRKGFEHNGNDNDETWVTLRPLPTRNPAYRRRGVLRRRYGMGDFDSDERKPKVRKVYNFTDNFKLENCSRLNYTQSSRNNDIECMSVLGPIRLNIIAENEHFSSSSSSSSEEGSDEESEEDDDEGEEEEENDEGEEAGNKIRRRKMRRHRKFFRRNYFRNRRRRMRINGKLGMIDKTNDKEGDKEREDDKNEENERDEREQHVNLSPKFRTLNHEEKFNDLDNGWTDYGEGIDCEESSEECGEDEEEEEEEEEEGEDEEETEGDGEEEENENQLQGKLGSSSPIRLDEKIPSTVCFVKKIVSDVAYNEFENGEFSWDKSVQSNILSAYYWGFLVSQIPGARLSNVIGGKLTLLIGVLSAGIVTLLTPVLASTGPYWLLTGRVVLGMMQGITMPAIQSLLAQWAPPIERTRMVACTYSGIAVGAALGGPLCEYLVQKIGWKVIFYGQGILALIWSLFWVFFASESPSTHPKISDKEKQLVTGTIGQQYVGKNLPIPWCNILRSRHVLGLMLAHGSFMWAWHTMLHYAPRYISTVLHRKRTEVQGVWGAALGCMFVTSCVYGFIADWLRKTRKTSTETIRRAANSICSLLGAVFLVGVAQSYCNTTAVEVCFALAIAVGFPGAFSGIFANSLDLAPNHAGIIAAICNTFATTANILSPFYWSLIVYERPTLERWRTVWYTSAIFLLLANCLYFLLVGTKEQRWNRPPMSLNKPPKVREEEQGAISKRRKNYTHGIKNQAYTSTDHL